MKKMVVIVCAVFAVALAVLIGTRMSADALGVLVGVVLGVLASLPTSLVLIWALVRRTQPNAGEPLRNGLASHPNYPPVVVVNPGPGYGVHGYGLPPLSSPSLPAPGGPRAFKVVGDEETLLDNVGHIFSGVAEQTEDRRH